MSPSFTADGRISDFLILIGAHRKWKLSTNNPEPSSSPSLLLNSTKLSVVSPAILNLEVENTYCSLLSCYSGFYIQFICKPNLSTCGYTRSTGITHSQELVTLCFRKYLSRPHHLCQARVTWIFKFLCPLISFPNWHKCRDINIFLTEACRHRKTIHRNSSFAPHKKRIIML